jgi:hypothetical protein
MANLSILGVDLAEAAITRARAKAAAAAPEVAGWWRFASATRSILHVFLDRSDQLSIPVFFHLLDPSERERFAGELAAALIPGGRYYLLGFAFESPMPNAPREVRENELRALFAPEHGWRVLAIRPARFQVRTARGNDVPAVAACIERVSPG